MKNTLMILFFISLLHGNTIFGEERDGNDEQKTEKAALTGNIALRDTILDNKIVTTINRKKSISNDTIYEKCNIEYTQNFTHQNEEYTFFIASTGIVYESLPAQMEYRVCVIPREDFDSHIKKIEKCFREKPSFSLKKAKLDFYEKKFTKVLIDMRFMFHAMKGYGIRYANDKLTIVFATEAGEMYILKDAINSDHLTIGKGSHVRRWIEKNKIDELKMDQTIKSSYFFLRKRN